MLIPEHSAAYEVGHVLGVAIRCLGTAAGLVLLVRRFRKPTLL
jgi:hypothetical protein